MKIIRKNTEPEYEWTVLLLVAFILAGALFEIGENGLLGAALFVLLVGTMFVLAGHDEAVLAPALAYMAGISFVFVGYEIALFTLAAAVIASVFTAYDEGDKHLSWESVIDYLLVTLLVALGSYVVASNMLLYGVGILIVADVLLRGTHHWDNWKHWSYWKVSGRRVAVNVRRWILKLFHCRMRA